MLHETRVSICNHEFTFHELHTNLENHTMTLSPRSIFQTLQLLAYPLPAAKEEQLTVVKHQHDFRWSFMTLQAVLLIISARLKHEKQKKCSPTDDCDAQLHLRQDGG